MDSDSSDSLEYNKVDSDSNAQDKSSTLESRKKTSSNRNKAPAMYELKNDSKMAGISLGNIKAKKNARCVQITVNLF